MHNEKVLLRQVSRHDEIAFKALFEAYQARLYHYIIHIIKSREAAEEMVIDVFLKIWQQRENLHEIESFDAYLFRMAFNKSIDFLRRAARTPEIRDLIWQEIRHWMDIAGNAALVAHLDFDQTIEAETLVAVTLMDAFIACWEEKYKSDRIRPETYINRYIDPLAALSADPAFPRIYQRA